MTPNEMIIWTSLCLTLVAGFMIYLSYKKSYDITNPQNRRTSINHTPENFKLAFETVFFNSSDGIELSGWFIPSPNESDKTIILCHGWGSNKGELLKDTYFLADKGFNLFYFDFRGSGDSKNASKYSVGYFETRDLEGAVQFVKSARPQQSSEIFLYGCSMGGSVAIYGAAHNPQIKALVAESTFLSFNSVIKNWSWKRLSVPYLPMVAMTLFFVKKKLKVDSNLYSPINNVGKLTQAVLFINGDNDDLVPLNEAQKLAELVKSEKELWIVKGATHAKCPEVAGIHFNEKVSAFFLANSAKKVNA